MQYDSNAEGRVHYADVMKDLLDDDAFALYMVTPCHCFCIYMTFDHMSQAS